MRRTVYLFLAVIFLFDLGALAQERRVDLAVDRIGLFRQQVDEIESTFGRTDHRLVEAYHELSIELVSASLFDEADEALSRAIQLVRHLEGIYTPAQIPLQLRRLETLGSAGNWRDVRERSPHLVWLLEGLLDGSLHEPLGESLGESLQEGVTPFEDSIPFTLTTLADLHLRGVTRDTPVTQAHHFNEAERINQLAIDVAYEVWGESDTRVAGLLYRRVLQNFMQAEVVRIGGESALTLRRYSDSGLAKTRNEALKDYYLSGLMLLAEIRNLYAGQPQPDLEAIGLADVYIADWQVIFGNPEAADQAYKRANDLLLTAGMEQTAINRFFASPMLLPVPDFHAGVDAAMAAAATHEIGEGPAEPSPLLIFRQWSAAFPYVITSMLNVRTEPGGPGVIYSFHLAGLDAVRRWHRDRYEKSVSEARHLERVSETFDQPVGDELERVIMDFRFRPRLVDGVPQPVNAYLVYQAFR
ncbi:MAG: hypothetical protein WDZ76_01685 [Pseudohongiellaceae bacterium]